MPRLVLGFLFAAHGVIHLGYVTPAPADPKYPFSLTKSWLISTFGMGEQFVQSLGVFLAVFTVIGYALAGLSAAGLIVPHDWWQPLVVASSVASLLLLVFFWHSWLIIGLGIDIALLVALFVFHWQPFATA